MALERRRIIFVGGISAITTEEEIFTYFQYFGRVTKVKIMREKKTKEPKGYAYVTMRDANVVPHVLGLSHRIGDRRVDCQLASRKGEKRLWKDEQRKRRIFVANLRLDMESKHLHHIFSVFGEVRIAYVISDYETKLSKGYGYVEFMEPQAALRALEAFKGNLTDDTKMQCLPYLGRHEQKIQQSSIEKDGRIDSVNAGSAASLSSSESNDSQRNLSYEASLQRSSKPITQDTSISIRMSDLCRILSKRLIWQCIATLKPIQHLSSNLRFNIGRPVDWEHAFGTREDPLRLRPRVSSGLIENDDARGAFLSADRAPSSLPLTSAMKTPHLK